MIKTQPNEDGVVFVYGKPHKYLVTYQQEGEVWTKMVTGHEIFDKMGMSDCYDISIEQLALMDDESKPTICTFHGTWHDTKDPLRMEIVHALTGEVYDVGYAPDH